MIKRILSPIDGSESSQSALSIAGSLAGIIEAELVGLFVEDESRFQDFSVASAIAQNLAGDAIIPPLLPPDQLLKREDEIEAESMQLYQLFQQRCSTAGISGRFLSVRGRPEDVIRDRARTVDFVVIGNSGRHSGVSQKQAGITVNALLRSITRPVLVVPDEALGDSCVVVAYDASPASERAIRAAAEFAEITEIDKVHVLTVAGSVAEAKATQSPAIEYLSAYAVDITPITLTGKPEEAICSYVQQVDASVLVLGAFGSNRMKEAIFGSTTEAVLHDAAAAVLLIS